MRCFESTEEIAARPDDVWTVLTDGPSWPAWDSGVESFTGQIALGEKVTVRVQAASGRAFPVVVSTLDAPRRLEFTGGMPLGLFRGVRTYTLEPTPAGTTSFRMREEYTGPLVSLIWRSMPDLDPSFRQFARGLKMEVESHG
jgi:hypothetical protein